jgi:hypothetical protein
MEWLAKLGGRLAARRILLLVAAATGLGVAALPAENLLAQAVGKLCESSLSSPGSNLPLRLPEVSSP